MCTANVCRSPMAAGFMVAETKRNPEAVRVASAGFLPAGKPTDPNGVRILAQHGVDLQRKRSRRLTVGLATESDLILTMTTRHTRDLVDRVPDAATKTFTMRDFVHAVRRRDKRLSCTDWVTQTRESAADRDRYLIDDSTLDIADPIGENRSVFASLADEMTEMIAWIARCSNLLQIEPVPAPPPGYRFRNPTRRLRLPGQSSDSRYTDNQNLD